MAIAFRSISTLVETAASTATRTITWPSGLDTGDSVVLVVHDNLTGNPVPSSIPSGFNDRLIRATDGGLASDFYTKYITDINTEPTWTISFGASSVKLIIYAAAYTGCDPGVGLDPVESDNSANEGASATTNHVTPAVTPLRAGSWLVTCAADRGSSIPTTWTGTDTERADGQNSGSNPVSSGYYDSNGPVSVSSQSRTLTASNANAVATMYGAILRPLVDLPFQQEVLLQAINRSNTY